MTAARELSPGVFVCAAESEWGLPCGMPAYVGYAYCGGPRCIAGCDVDDIYWDELADRERTAEDIAKWRAARGLQPKQTGFGDPSFRGLRV